MITKVYTVRLTAHDALHKMLYDYIKRFLFTEGRKIGDSEIEVKNV